jgi:hypothetical protein
MELRRLADEFPAEDIEWRIQQSGMKNGKPWAKILAYITNRAIMDRLDAVCGPENWRNEFSFAPFEGFMCGISIRIGEEWVTKWDGAEKSDIEPFKGGLSNAMKRAAVQWGMGRYLYHWDTAWADFDGQGVYSAKIENQWYKWSPPFVPAPKKGILDIPEPTHEELREPPMFAPEPDLHEARRKELDGWLLEMAGGVESEYKALLKRVSTFTGKDELEHFAESIGKLSTSKSWTNTTHHNAKTIYEAWKDLQKNKERHVDPAPEPGGLFPSSFGAEYIP